MKRRIYNGGLAQLARAPALHAGGQRFESVILHLSTTNHTRRKRATIKIKDILKTVWKAEKQGGTQEMGSIPNSNTYAKPILA